MTHEGYREDDRPGEGLDPHRTFGEVSDEAGLTGVLDALEDLVGQARAMPMSSTVLVSRPEVLDLLGRARAILPDQLRRADEVLADADAVRAGAQAEVDAVIAAAEARAAELVSQEAVVRAAQERAAAILAEAEETASRMRHDADDYCDRRLADFEIDLGKVVAQVQAGRAKLAGRLTGNDGGA